MSKFQKVEKFSNNNLIEKMDDNTEIVIVGEFEVKTPSCTTDIILGISLDNTAMCTIKSTDNCPAGFVSSSFCAGQNNTDVNTTYCVMDSNYVIPYAPSLSNALSSSNTPSAPSAPSVSRFNTPS